jgi:putative ATP-binding cassette transporter
VTTGFTVLTPVVPLVIAAPHYVAGELSLGALIQASQAFVQVQLALGFVIDNYARLSDWMAAINRIVQLKTAIDDIERDLVEPGERHIASRPSPEGALRFVDLNVDGSDGTVVIDNASEAIKPGERVLVIGESGVGKTTLLRAIAGLWPWGSGTIELPPEERMMFMLHRPYMPPGTLRAALAYPEPPERFGEAELRAALTRCGLERFIDRLDDEARWDEAMAEGEQQRLAFARLLVHRPGWVLMDEATSELDETAEADMMSLFKNELAGTTLVSTGQRASLATYHDRTLTLARSPDGAHLLRGPPKPRRASLGRRFLPW